MGFTYTRPPLTQALSGIVIIGGALLTMAAPGAESVWADYVNATPAWVLVVAVPIALHLAVFWLMVAGFHYVDRNDRPAFIARYRIQDDSRRQPPLGQAVRNVLVHQLGWSPPLMAGMWGLLVLRGWSPQTELPSALQVLAELAGMTVLSLVWFYASHRFLHRPWWLKKVHRIHHEFGATRAIAAEYSHWFEFVAGSFGTMACGVVIVAPSLATIYLFTVAGIHQVVTHHSGYAVPWLSWSLPHDWHHYRFKENFGTYGVIDRLLGTDAEFKTLKHGDKR